MTFVGRNHLRHKLLLNKFADSLKIDKISLKGRVLHLEDIEQTVKTHLHVFYQAELVLTAIQSHSSYLHVRKELVILQDLLSCDFVVYLADLAQEIKGQVGRHLIFL